MKRSLLILVTTAGAALLLLPAAMTSRASDVQQDLAGVYSCEGLLPDGTTYRGTVEIVRHANTFQLLWTMSPERRYLGLGLVNGNTMAVSYFGGFGGVVAYQIVRGDRGPTLVGQWSEIHADGLVFTETLKKVGPSSGKLHFRVPPAALHGRPGRPA